MHFDPKYSRIRSVSSHWKLETNNPETYRSGHNGTDSKFLEAPAVSSAENVRRTGLCAGSDFTISYRSCVFFLHSSGAGITLEIYGELSERSKVRHSKSCRSLSGVTLQTLDTSGFFRFSTLFQNWISTVFLRFVYDFYTWFSISRKPAKPWKYSMEMYRSGRNEADSKSSGHLVVSSPQNPYRIRLFAGSNNWIFCCSTLEFYPKVFPFKRSFWGRKSGEHTWRRIEVVITGLTRNQLTGNRPWVRIPPSPPIWLENTTFSSLFLHFFEVFRNFLFTMVLQAGENLG